MTYVTNQPSPPITPVFDYTSRDYASIFADLLNRIPLYLPEWTSQSQNDFGIVLLQMFAYVGDILGYYLDRLSGEAFIQTATQPTSVLNLAKMLDYTPALSTGSSVMLQITIGPSATNITIPAGSLFSTVASASTPSAIVFQTTLPLTIAGPGGSGTVPAIQAVTQTNETVGTSDGSINQVFPLLYNPVSANPAAQVFVDLGLGAQEWTYAEDLIDYSGQSLVYTYFVDPNGIFYIVFGDNVNGYVPPLGCPITCTYSTNSGTTGNVGAGLIIQPLSVITGVTGVTNPAAASGGADAESLSSIQVNAPASLTALSRAVATNDFAVLAQQVSGVQWASAVMATYQLVNLYIAPTSGGNMSSALQAAVQSYINEISMANTTVTLANPTYVPINISANIEALSNFGQVTTQSNVVNTLTALFSLPNTGFGARVSQAILYQVINQIAGVNYLSLIELNRQMLVTTTSVLNSGTYYTSISCTPLPQTVYAGDSLVLSNGSTTQTSLIVVATTTQAGAISIPVDSFQASSTFPVGSNIQDITGTNDCILLPNEIPVVGNLTITVSGGVAGV